MTRFNYSEPEFKVIVSATEDVITTSTLEVVDQEWESNNGSSQGGGVVDPSNLFSL